MQEYIFIIEISALFDGNILNDTDCDIPHSMICFKDATGKACVLKGFCHVKPFWHPFYIRFDILMMRPNALLVNWALYRMPVNNTVRISPRSI